MGAFGGKQGMGTDIIPQSVSTGAQGFGGGGLMDMLMEMGVFHAGGILGGKAPGMRRVGASVFNGAPRFHGGGIMGDEIPIIGKRGEGVFTREQMANLAPVGGMGAGVAPVINIIAPAGTKAETRTRQDANGGMTTDVFLSIIEDGLADRVGAGQGSLGAAIEARYGVNTAVS